MKSNISGLFNVGTGVARSFEEFLSAASVEIPLFSSANMPYDMLKTYQFYTKADLTKLRVAGYNKPFLSVEDGVGKYVKDYLSC